jgi:hypothetical protein
VTLVAGTKHTTIVGTLGVSCGEGDGDWLRQPPRVGGSVPCRGSLTATTECDGPSRRRLSGLADPPPAGHVRQGSVSWYDLTASGVAGQRPVPAEQLDGNTQRGAPGCTRGRGLAVRLQRSALDEQEGVGSCGRPQSPVGPVATPYQAIHRVR